MTALFLNTIKSFILLLNFSDHAMSQYVIYASCLIVHSLLAYACVFTPIVLKTKSSPSLVNESFITSEILLDGVSIVRSV